MPSNDIHTPSNTLHSNTEYTNLRGLIEGNIKQLCQEIETWYSTYVLRDDALIRRLADTLKPICDDEVTRLRQVRFEVERAAIQYVASRD